MKKTRRITDDDAPSVDLAISPATVCFLIVKAREFDGKVEVSDPDPGSDRADDADASVLEDHDDDPVEEEMIAAIHDLSDDEQIDLVAIAWLGRGDYTAADWPALREEAAEAHNRRTARYLLGMPMLGDYLEEGLAQLGRGCAEHEIGRL